MIHPIQYVLAFKRNCPRVKTDDPDDTELERLFLTCQQEASADLRVAVRMLRALVTADGAGQVVGKAADIANEYRTFLRKLGAM